MHTSFSILLGDIDLATDFIRSDNSTIGFIFYYSYISIVFFVLLNILLAILVDAYMEVKADAEDSKTVFAEVKDVLVDGRPGWRGSGANGGGKYRASEGEGGGSSEATAVLRSKSGNNNNKPPLTTSCLSRRSSK